MVRLYLLIITVILSSPANAAGVDAIFIIPASALFIIAMSFSVVRALGHTGNTTNKLILSGVVLFVPILVSSILIEVNFVLLILVPFTPLITYEFAEMCIYNQADNDSETNNESQSSLANENQCSEQSINLIEKVIDNDIDGVNMALYNGGNPNEINSTGYSALDYARGHGYAAIQHILQSHIIADSNSKAKNLKYNKSVKQTD